MRLTYQFGLPRATILAALALLALTATACAGGNDGDTDNAAGDDGLISCRALEELDSYRYGVSVETSTTEAQSAEATATSTAAPLTALADALANLFSDFQINGSYVKPDRADAILTFADDELELRVIGEEAWVRSGGEWVAEEAATDDLLTPLVICDEVLQQLSLSLRASEEEPAEANGVAARHYELDPGKTQDLPSLLGQEIAGGYTVDLWVAKDGRWPAQLLIESSDGQDERQFSLAMDVRDVNDEGIEIEPPE